MFLFKASGATYRKVVSQSLHAFPYGPAEAEPDDFVLLSKNREDCRDTERQIQFVAKILTLRSAKEGELDRFFPGVAASERWRHVVELYWTRKLPRPFNLSEVPRLDHTRYDRAQLPTKFDPDHASALVDFLAETNRDLLVDVVNNAVRPDPR